MLESFLERNTNRLVLTSRDSNQRVPFTRKMIEELANVSQKTVVEFVKECKNKKILVEVQKEYRKSEFYLNPVYCLNGQYITCELYLMFQGSEIDKYVSEPMKLKLEHYLQNRDF